MNRNDLGWIGVILLLALSLIALVLIWSGVVPSPLS